ncbi:hypothetical protein FNW02_28970 [Komarekiella sp. 'clone 1']|uniref:Uncharacterized protein n=1 Tax=Komarekiella delphini-convector SJRDD-AB1 TaxID=2593771 RepID=A0AA40VU14_9NOST|nr:hypothetical protein [Komarekiella delphini-convector]MBD6619739.1 hypothetical protein [Komarekiella delphini-convector SJRDD-AB1]
MLEIAALQRNHLYEFRGQQLRYSHRSNCGLLARYVFTNSSLRRKELSENQVVREVIELNEFRDN